MRLDKFLHLTRLVRRRAFANSLCHAGRVVVNGRPAPPAAPVRPGDLITIEAGARRIRVRVRSLPAGREASGDHVDVLEDQAVE